MTTRQTARLVQSQKLRLNSGLSAAIKVLRYDASGLSRYLEEQASDNPFLSVAPSDPAPGEWLPRWSGAFSGTRSDMDVDLGALIGNPAPGLIAHVMDQVGTLVPIGRAREIADILIQSLEPSGWLGRPLAVLAREAGASVPETEAVLAQLQHMEPTGIFARSLFECLTLQALEADCHDPVMACMLQHLDLLASGDLARLADMCNVSQLEISKRLRLIRSFDPKPGAQFDQGAAPVREPDLTVHRTDGGWHLSLNRSCLPELTITKPVGVVNDPEDRLALANARALERIVASRNATLLRVGREVLLRQEAALDRGLESLVPMSMADIAQALNFHESTVSRAVAGVSVDTPRGTFWLRSLFTSAIGEAGLSAGAVRARLVKLVAKEDPSAPLGDQALADALSGPGAPLARRTIAKYRDMLKIPTASRRKRRFA